MSFVSKSLLASIPEDDDLPLDEWAEKYVRFPGSPIAEDFRRDNIPMLIEPMRAWDDPKIWGVSVLAGVQGGKTGFEQIAVARALKKRPGNMMITTQTDSESAFFAKTKLLPCLRESPGTRDIVAGLGRDDITKEHIITPAMFIQIQGPSLSGLQSKTIHYILNDEMWRWKKGTMAEILRRANAVRNKKVLSVSQGGEQIANEYGESDWDEWGAWWHQGTQKIFHVQCPHCEKYFSPETRREDDGKFILCWDETPETRNIETKEWNWKAVRQTVRMQCPECDGVIENRERVRRELVQNWKYVQTNFNNSPGHESFRYSGYTLWWRDWADIIESFLRAKDSLRRGSIEELKAFTQKEEAKFWTIKDKDIPIVNTKGAAGYRVEDYDKGAAEEAPQINGEEQRFGFADMQKDRFPVCIRAFGGGGSRLLYCEELQKIEEVDEAVKHYGLKSGAFALDVGNWKSDALDFCHQYKWSAMRGRDINNFTKTRGKRATLLVPYQRVIEYMTGKAHHVKGQKIKVLEFSNTYFKDVFSRLRAMEEHQIPDDICQLYVDSMESETKDSKRGIWRQIGKRPNHYWDCEIGITFMAFLYKLVGAPEPETEESSH